MFPATGGRGAGSGEPVRAPLPSPGGRRSWEPARTQQLSKKRCAGLNAAGVSPYNSSPKALHHRRAIYRETKV